LDSGRKKTASQAFYYAIEKMQRVAIQTLDLLPPVDITFRDYVFEVLRMYSIANLNDVHKYFDLILACFVKRKILTRYEVNKLKEPSNLYDRLDLKVFHEIDSVFRSRATAYRF